jgi:hypothetical protein
MAHKSVIPKDLRVCALFTPITASATVSLTSVVNFFKLSVSICTIAGIALLFIVYIFKICVVKIEQVNSNGGLAGCNRKVNLKKSSATRADRCY